MPSNEPGPQTNGLSALTLFIASLSSVVAALVVRKVWGPGTLVGAAATPVIITLVAELLRKPAARITVVGAPPGPRKNEGPVRGRRGTPAEPRPGTSAYDPVAAGRAGLAAGAQPVFAGPSTPATTRSRRRVRIALTGGLVAFAVGAVLLTGSELLLGGSSVGSSSDRTTIFPGRSTRTTTTPTTTRDPSTTTAPATSTTTPPSTATPQTPAPAPSGPTTSAPSAAPTTPAAPPPATTTAPAPSAAPPVP